VCGDLTCDAGEDPCNCEGDCGPPPFTETNCGDSVDNDCDGDIDCDDSNCSEDPTCTCLDRGSPCELNDDCCSGRCHTGTCK
jgi:hypothetical protein